MSKNRRLELHKILVDILGLNNVYYQPPESSKMNYPCIIYHTDTIGVSNADDRIYMATDKYSIQVVDADPDSETHLKLLDLPYCRPERKFTLNNLNYWNFTLYF